MNVIRKKIRLWRGPVVCGSSIAFGLLAALLGQGYIWHGLAWAALALPLLAIVIFAWPWKRYVRG